MSNREVNDALTVFIKFISWKLKVTCMNIDCSNYHWSGGKLFKFAYEALKEN